VRLYTTHSLANVWRRSSAADSLLKPSPASDMRTLDYEYSAANEVSWSCNVIGDLR
jgi:hypothetical protein